MSAFHDSCTQLGHRHGPPDGGRLCAPVKSINMALLTEGELALSWIDSERQNNNTNASPSFNQTRVVVRTATVDCELVGNPVRAIRVSAVP